MIEEVPGGVRIRVRIQPGASTTGPAGLHDGRLKLRVQAPPLDGRANTAVIEWFAGRFEVPRRSVTLVRGERSRDKTIEVAGVTQETAVELLGR